MDRLILKLDGQEISELHLEEGMEYIVGRSVECDIVIEGQKGVSRQHIRIYQAEGQWAAELLSKVGKMSVDGESSENCFLSQDHPLKVARYELHFFTDTSTPEKTEDEGLDHAPLTSQAQEQNFDHDMLDISEEGGNMDATSPGLTKISSVLSAYLTVNQNQGASEVLKLEGNYWVCGRDENCEIYINNNHMSRRHFELTKEKHKYIFRDLGSSNGSKINGEPAPQGEAIELLSGDRIDVLSISITFEVRDTAFQNKVEVLSPNTPITSAVPANLPVPSPGAALAPGVPAGANIAPLTPQQHQIMMAQQQAQLGLNVVKMTAPSEPQTPLEKLKNFDWKKNKVRVIAGAVIFLALIIGLSSGSKNPEKGSADASSTAASFESLKAEQKSIVKDLYQLATHYYKNEYKYTLCIAELDKLHKIVPFYKDSKEIYNYCQIGQDTKREQEEKTRLRKQRAEIEAQINLYVTKCREKIETLKTIEEARECLAPAIERDPQHPDIQDVLTVVQLRLEEDALKQAQREKRQKIVRAGVSAYNKAKSASKSGSLRSAINAYQIFLSKNYPDPQGLRPKAKRAIASLRKELDTKVEAKLEECQKLAQSQKMKDAIYACDDALKEDPTNAKAKAKRALVLSELRKNMKFLYEDSILEESLGNVDAAKEKWKQIMLQNIPSDDYFKKAKSKLKKYGVGI
jgi:pSer/pThr/pTyr-binding forkhead associated (FHA) protein